SDGNCSAASGTPTLVSAPACTAAVERYLRKGPPEALSNAALEVLAIVAYEQPVTRADIREIRGTDSDSVVETLMARRLITEDPPFGGRGRPSFLVTTSEFLRRFGLSSRSGLPPRPDPAMATPNRMVEAVASMRLDGDNDSTGRTKAHGY